jgi:hypothetical protein
MTAGGARGVARPVKSAEAKAARVATPWGAAVLVERLQLPQRAGEKRFSSVVELLENERGERLVRFAYSTDGVARRGPVTLRERDLERLRAELERRPALAELLRLGEGGGA